MNHPEEQPVFERGSGNVFADLGLDDADELFARSQLGFQVWKILKARNLKQREIADLLGIKQPEVSHLMNGEFSRFSEGKLMNFLKRLDREVVIQINAVSEGRYQPEATLTL
jgi:predicted XRE-type DNA-binding protein